MRIWLPRSRLTTGLLGIALLAGCSTDSPPQPAPASPTPPAAPAPSSEKLATTSVNAPDDLAQAPFDEPRQALVPEGWARMFTSDPQVVAATVSYITHVAPFYCLFGLGMTLSFASQGAGRMAAPFVAGITRLIVATVGGWFAVEVLGWGLSGVFTAIAVGMICFGSRTELYVPLPERWEPQVQIGQHVKGGIDVLLKEKK